MWYRNLAIWGSVISKLSNQLRIGFNKSILKGTELAESALVDSRAAQSRFKCI
jgi:hypothetical protein